jgi:hypothetical protein
VRVENNSNDGPNVSSFSLTQSFIDKPMAVSRARKGAAPSAAADAAPAPAAVKSGGRGGRGGRGGGAGGSAQKESNNVTHTALPSAARVITLGKK